MIVKCMPDKIHRRNSYTKLRDKIHRDCLKTQGRIPLRGEEEVKVNWGHMGGVVAIIS